MAEHFRTTAASATTVVQELNLFREAYRGDDTNFPFWTPWNILPETALWLRGIGGLASSFPAGVGIGLQPGLTPESTILTTQRPADRQFIHYAKWT